MLPIRNSSPGERSIRTHTLVNIFTDRCSRVDDGRADGGQADSDSHDLVELYRAFPKDVHRKAACSYFSWSMMIFLMVACVRIRPLVQGCARGCSFSDIVTIS